MVDKKDPAEIARDILNSSGFPFQLAVERRIRDTARSHEWKVLPRELPWWNDRGKFGFFDIVLQRDRCRATVECKRTRGGRWVFLVENDARQNGAGRFITSYAHGGKEGVVTLSFAARPTLYQSEFCAIRGTGENDRPMIERLSAQLLESTRALAARDVRGWRGDNVTDEWVYIPILVTNAELWVCSFSARTVSLETGELPPDAATEKVTGVWFHRTLVADESVDEDEVVDDGIGGDGRDFYALKRASERSVLVVYAPAIETHLTQLGVTGQPAKQRLRL